MPTVKQITSASLSYYSTVRSFSHDSRMYLITSALFGFAIFGGIYTTLLNLYLLRLGFGPQEAGLINGWGQLAFGVVALPARWCIGFISANPPKIKKPPKRRP